MRPSPSRSFLSIFPASWEYSKKKKEILDGAAGGCDRWRYRDESLVNVATGRAITMTSTPVSPASSASSSSSSAGETGRQLLLVPKDKSFATQKFLVMTSGSIVAKDNAFVVAVEDRMRGWCPSFFDASGISICLA